MGSASGFTLRFKSCSAEAAPAISDSVSSKRSIAARFCGATGDLQQVECRECEPRAQADAERTDSRQPVEEAPHERRVHQRPGGSLEASAAGERRLDGLPARLHFLPLIEVPFDLVIDTRW